MRRRLLIVAALAAVFMAAPVAADADSASTAEQARSLVTTMANDGIASLTGEEIPPDEREARFRNIMGRYFAITNIARWVVGRAAWERASEAEREAFVDVFEDLIIETYAHRFAEYQGETLAIDDAFVHENGDVLVRSRIVRPATTQPLHVDWRVRVRGDGTQQVIDIVVEGLSMAQKQRSEFDSFLRQHDRSLTALIEELRQRIEDARAQRGGQKS